MEMSISPTPSSLPAPLSPTTPPPFPLLLFAATLKSSKGNYTCVSMDPISSLTLLTFLLLPITFAS